MISIMFELVQGVALNNILNMDIIPPAGALKIIRITFELAQHVVLSNVPNIGCLISIQMITSVHTVMVQENTK